MTDKNQLKVRIGGHVSMSGGLDQAVQRAADIGANCMQIFSGSPRMWRRRELDNFAVRKMLSKREELDVEPVFTHALYLINLASDKTELVDKSVRSLIYDLKFDSLVKGSGVVVHLGSHQGRGWEVVKSQLKDKISYILDNTPTDSRLLIENSAGQSGKIASDLAEISWLLDEIGSDRLGWCVDTCHAFAAGYSLAQNSQFSQDKKHRGYLITEIQKLNLDSSLSCVHVNDSQTEFASGSDRHANIGDGKIPPQELKDFLNHSLIIKHPLITEVPGLDGSGPDQENIKRIKQLVGIKV
jgi:deoxyribonuclease-4